MWLAGLQMKLLKLLALLGAGDQGCSENMYHGVAAAMREGAKHGNTIGNALVYEAVRTVTAIYPNPALLQSGEAPPLDLEIRIPDGRFPYTFLGNPCVGMWALWSELSASWGL